MKKIIAVLSLLSLLLLSGCTPVGGNSHNAEEKPLVAATIFPPYDFAREVAGDRAEVTMLMPTGAESHDYEPTLQNIDTVSRCDVFIYVGGGVDKWAQKLLDAAPNNNRRVICLSELVPVIHLDGHSHDHAHHDHEGEEFDEHIWTLPNNVEVIASKIASVLCEIDESDTEYYKARLANYNAQLKLLYENIGEIVESSQTKTLCFADRFAFRYLADGYGLNYFAAIDGCESDAEPTLAALNNVIDCIQKNNLSVVLYTESGSPDIVKRVTDITGVKGLMMYSCHSISGEQLADGVTYITMMKHNTEVLKEALS